MDNLARDGRAEQKIDSYNYLGAKSREIPNFLKILSWLCHFRLDCPFLRYCVTVSVRKNKKAAVRRNIQILTPISDQEQGPDFTTQGISCSIHEKNFGGRKLKQNPTSRILYRPNFLKICQLQDS